MQSALFTCEIESPSNISVRAKVPSVAFPSTAFGAEHYPAIHLVEIAYQCVHQNTNGLKKRTVLNFLVIIINSSCLTPSFSGSLSNAEFFTNSFVKVFCDIILLPFSQFIEL